ncbi:DODA-type extradiol aromatic ring-opening family dioxygenase [Oricola sp.]|uniref:DODA-type extradiol aromatic ring-opening family dioxygenase n=1 Tax=Oricola sp. TaxID=1979950 RepID=UPI003BAC768F
MTAMPSVFVSHGGPNVVIEDTEARDYLSSLASLLPQPKAIVVMSAHFETDGPVVVSDPKPGMIYDFGGFQKELYEMVYPAPGDPELAGRVAGLLGGAGLSPRIMPERGYDHGTWNPLILAYPDADIPVVQVSVDPSRDAAYHYAVGAALAQLREEGVLLLGSGHITHNLRAIFGIMRGGEAVDPELAGRVNAFTEWFAEQFAKGDREAVLDWSNRAPYVADNHPTDEHLMPLFFAYGAGGADTWPERRHNSLQFGVFAWDSWFFN